MGAKRRKDLFITGVVLIFMMMLAGCGSSAMSDADLVSNYFNAESSEEMEKYITYKEAYEPLFKGTFLQQRIENEQLVPRKVSQVKTSDKLKKDGFKIISVSLQAKQNGTTQADSFLVGIAEKGGKKLLQPDSLISTECHSSARVDAKINVACTAFNIGRTADGHTVIVIQLVNHTPDNYAFNWVQAPVIYLTDGNGNKVKSSAISSVGNVDVPQNNPRDRFEKDGGPWVYIIPFANFTGEIKSLTIEPLVKLDNHGLPVHHDMNMVEESITVIP